MQRSETLRSRSGEPTPADAPDTSVGHHSEPHPLSDEGHTLPSLETPSLLKPGEAKPSQANSSQAHDTRPGADSSQNPPTQWLSSVLAPGLELSQRYRIVRFVARGGMGEVYEARDEALGERIALKTVAAHSASDSEALDGLKVEVQLARRISHKNVCRIFDIGKHQPADSPVVWFLTMEFIEGSSLAERIRAVGKLDAPEARRLAVGILEGLDAAHHAGVIHRDLKSDNVMLRALRGHFDPVLMDFGLASALNPNSSRVSGDQALVGSLAYMAPEQVRGEPLRAATDLYAFGVILFEMLTGRMPFEGPTPAIAAIRRLQEPAPSVSMIEPSVPHDLVEVVRRCLERDPKRRFGSARAILDALTDEASNASPTDPGALPSSGTSRAPASGPRDSGRERDTDSRRRSTDLVLTAHRRDVRSERRLWLTLGLALVTVIFLARGSFTRSPTAADPAARMPAAGETGSEAQAANATHDDRRAAASSGQIAAPSVAAATENVAAIASVAALPSVSGNQREVSPGSTALGLGGAAPSTSVRSPGRVSAARAFGARAVGAGVVGAGVSGAGGAASAASPSTLPSTPPATSEISASGGATPRACPPGLLCPDSLTPKHP